MDLRLKERDIIYTLYNSIYQSTYLTFRIKLDDITIIQTDSLEHENLMSMTEWVQHKIIHGDNHVFITNTTDNKLLVICRVLEVIRDMDNVGADITIEGCNFKSDVDSYNNSIINISNNGNSITIDMHNIDNLIDSLNYIHETYYVNKT